jgi:hypothetical protein
MKKTLIILLLILPVLFASGQAAYNDSKEDFWANMQRNKKFRTYITTAGIRSSKKFEYKHNDSTGFLAYEFRYDNNGNNTDWLEYKKNGKIKLHVATTYNDSNWMTHYEYSNRSGKPVWSDALTYDKWGNITEEDGYLESPKKLFSQTFNTYDSLNNITESKIFNKRRKLITRVEYTYYTDGSKKQTIQYSGKGKVQNIWNFDCNPVGDAQAKKLKDTGKVCIHYETDKDGKPIKIREEYTRTDGLFGKSMRRTITKYDKDNNILEVASCKLNGKETEHWSATYNEKGKMTEYNIYSPGTKKTWEKYTYTYNSNGNITGMICYKRAKETPDATYKWVYNQSK